MAPHGDQMEYADIVLYFLVAFIDILIIFFILDFQFGIDCENEEILAQQKKKSFDKWKHVLPGSFYDNKHYQDGETIGVNKPYYLSVCSHWKYERQAMCLHGAPLESYLVIIKITQELQMTMTRD